MKRPISWHEECLNHYKEYLESDRRRLENIRLAYEQSVARYNFNVEQLAEAKRRGLDAYDSERFMRTKRGNK